MEYVFIAFAVVVALVGLLFAISAGAEREDVAGSIDVMFALGIWIFGFAVDGIAALMYYGIRALVG